MVMIWNLTNVDTILTLPKPGQRETNLDQAGSIPWQKA